MVVGGVVEVFGHVWCCVEMFGGAAGRLPWRFVREEARILLGRRIKRDIRKFGSAPSKNRMR